VIPRGDPTRRIGGVACPGPLSEDAARTEIRGLAERIAKALGRKVGVKVVTGVGKTVRPGEYLGYSGPPRGAGGPGATTGSHSLSPATRMGEAMGDSVSADTGRAGDPTRR